ncbi:hypothetical protein [Actinomadura coerulea]|uniref:hypothetical protein n=1 Tax=Actinomadura coerulea TaxID=46159 RepID=UPI003421BCA0
MVRMDILEHRDGVWEIVYGPSYTNPKPPTRRRIRVASDAEVQAVQPFAMPGWEHYSTWGFEEVHGRRDLGHMYAQLYLNTDDRDGKPRIWITPPRHTLTTIDQLAEAIATEIAPRMGITIPPELIRDYLVK